MGKPTKAEKQKRVRAIYELILSGTTRYDMIQYGANKWGVKVRTVDAYIKAANVEIGNEIAASQRDALATQIARREHLYRRALKAGDLNLALNVSRDETKLLDLYPSTKRVNSNLDIDMSKLTDEQLQRIADGEDPLTVIAS